MTMTPTEARELRAALAEALDPLYAARLGTVPALDAVLRAIPVLHRIDAALVRAANLEGAPGHFTPQERAWVVDSVAGSQRLAGVPVTHERAAQLLDEVEGRPLPDIGGEG